MGTPFSIVIVGGGTAGWMAANLMAKHWHGQPVSITLVESDTIGTIGVGEGSTPYLKGFFKKLNIPESEWMPACNATYKCGIRFPNWSTVPGYESYYHPFFSPLDREVGQVFFQQAELRRRGESIAALPDHFFHAPYLSSDCRAPIPKRPLPFELDYGYHFDAGLLGQFLRGRAIEQGVEHCVDTVVRVEREGDTVLAIHGERSGKMVADLFIDCSGFRSLLIADAPGYQFREYRKTLFNNAAVAVQRKTSAEAPLPSETVSEGLSSGWMWSIPLQSRTGHGYVYSTQFVSPDEAEQELRQRLHLNDAETVRHLNMRVGRVEEHWQGNVLAVGLSQGFIEPLEATALMLVQFTIERFLQCSEVGVPDQSGADSRDGFNRQINALFDGVLDYVAGHYRINTRADTPYWRAAREEMQVPERLSALLECWDSGGNVDNFLLNQGSELIYSRASWYSLLAGMGRFPEGVLRQPQETRDAEAVAEFCRSNLRQFWGHRDKLNALKNTAVEPA